MSKFNKIVNYLSFEMIEKKMWDNFQRIITFYPKNCQSSSKYGLGIRDPGDGTIPFRIPDPGVKKAPDPGAVLSLTVDKVISITIFISAGTCPVTGGSRAAGSNSCSATAHGTQPPKVRFLLHFYWGRVGGMG